ncbi:unnamed protein product [Parajaminaea phylloscopi]
MASVLSSLAATLRPWQTDRQPDHADFTFSAPWQCRTRRQTENSDEQALGLSEALKSLPPSDQSKKGRSTKDPDPPFGN